MPRCGEIGYAKMKRYLRYADRDEDRELPSVTNREFTTEDPAVRPKGTISVY